MSARLLDLAEYVDHFRHRVIVDAVAEEDMELSRTLAETRTKRNMRFLIAAHLELTGS